MSLATRNGCSALASMAGWSLLDIMLLIGQRVTGAGGTFEAAPCCCSTPDRPSPTVFAHQRPTRACAQPGLAHPMKVTTEATVPIIPETVASTALGPEKSPRVNWAHRR